MNRRKISSVPVGAVIAALAVIATVALFVLFVGGESPMTKSLKNPPVEAPAENR